MVDNAINIDEIPWNELFSDYLGEGRLDVFELAVDMLDGLSTGVAEGAGSPDRGAREIWAAPNPFLGETGIHLNLPGGGLSNSPVEIGIFSVSGRAVRTARLSSERSGSGLIFRWDGRDENGAPVAAGRYMIRATVGGETVVRSMTLLR